MRDENWDDLRVILAVYRQPSLVKAGRALGVNESTVARRLARAEHRLGARLFQRDNARLEPTAAGLEMIARAEHVELEVQTGIRAVSGTDARVAGLVRMTAVPVLVNRVLVPALPALMARHPELRVELTADPRGLSLIKRETDVALRLNRPRAEVRAVARKIGQLVYAVYGPPGMSPDSLPWISYGDAMRDLPQAQWIAQAVGRSPASAPRILVNDAETMLACVRSGLGKTLLPAAIADQSPGIVKVAADEDPLAREIWLLVHPELRKLRRIRTVMDWAAQICAGLAAGGGVASVARAAPSASRPIRSSLAFPQS